jgi:hypothetical protein
MSDCCSTEKVSICSSPVAKPGLCPACGKERQTGCYVDRQESDAGSQSCVAVRFVLVLSNARL